MTHTPLALAVWRLRATPEVTHRPDTRPHAACAHTSYCGRSKLSIHLARGPPAHHAQSCSRHVAIAHSAMHTGVAATSGGRPARAQWGSGVERPRWRCVGWAHPLAAATPVISSCAAAFASTQRTHVRFGFVEPDTGCFVGEHWSHTSRPHFLQWCRRRMIVHSRSHSSQHGESSLADHLTPYLLDLGWSSQARLKRRKGSGSGCGGAGRVACSAGRPSSIRAAH